MKPLILYLLRVLGRTWCRLHGAEVHSEALVHGFPKIRIRKGGRLVLEAGATINAAGWSNPFNDGRRTVLYVGPGAEICLAKNAGISSSVLVAHAGIRIDEGALVGAGCLICDSDMHELPLGSDSPVKTAPIRIGKSAFVGARSTILRGVEIGDGAVVGAHSVVRESIAPGVRVKQQSIE